MALDVRLPVGFPITGPRTPEGLHGATRSRWRARAAHRLRLGVGDRAGGDGRLHHQELVGLVIGHAAVGEEGDVGLPGEGNSLGTAASRGHRRRRLVPAGPVVSPIRERTPEDPGIGRETTNPTTWLMPSATASPAAASAPRRRGASASSQTKPAAASAISGDSASAMVFRYVPVLVIVATSTSVEAAKASSARNRAGSFARRRPSMTPKAAGTSSGIRFQAPAPRRRRRCAMNASRRPAGPPRRHRHHDEAAGDQRQQRQRHADPVDRIPDREDPGSGVEEQRRVRGGEVPVRQGPIGDQPRREQVDALGVVGVGAPLPHEEECQPDHRDGQMEHRGAASGGHTALPAGRRRGPQLRPASAAPRVATT